MALRTVGRELELRMIGLCSLKVARMAAVAVGRHGGVITQRTILVAGVTVHCGMRAQQWEPIVVLLDLLRLHAPAPY